MQPGAPQEGIQPSIRVDDQAFYARYRKAILNGAIDEELADPKLIAWMHAQNPSHPINFSVILSVGDKRLFGELTAWQTLGEGSLDLPVERGQLASEEVRGMVRENQKVIIDLTFGDIMGDYRVSGAGNGGYRVISLGRSFTGRLNSEGWRIDSELFRPEARRAVVVLSALGFAENLAHDSGGQFVLSPRPFGEPL